MKAMVKRMLGPLVPSRTYGSNSLQGMRHRELVELLDEELTKRRFGSELQMLDVGCGDGQLLMACAQPGRHRHGCDWLERPQAGDRFDYRRVDLNRDGLATYSAATFDTVLCSDVLEHMENPALILREIARVLKPAGFAIISIPNSWNILERWRFLFTSNFRRYRSERRSGPWGHISFFTPDILQSLCDRAGLQITRVTGGGRRGHLAAAGLRLRVMPSTLLTYNIYVVLSRSGGAPTHPAEATAHAPEEP